MLLLTYAARYTEVREELLLRLSADEAARRDETVKAYADEVGNTALDAATAYADEKLTEKQGKIANIAISDFDTFNPSNTAETKTLAYGEFVCFTSYDAIGRPDAGTSTYARICTGRITRLYGQYYRLEALTGGAAPYRRHTHVCTSTAKHRTGRLARRPFPTEPTDA